MILHIRGGIAITGVRGSFAMGVHGPGFQLWNLLWLGFVAPAMSCICHDLCMGKEIPTQSALFTFEVIGYLV